MTSEPHIVIIGGGFGGLDAARQFAGEPVRVTLIDRHNYHLFQPLLYQVATASLSPGDIASPIRWVLRRQRNLTVLLGDVQEIDPAAQQVLMNTGAADDGRPAGTTSIRYDYLILASGSAHAYFGHPEWADRAPGLKTLDDALEIRRRVLLAFEAAEREPSPDAQRRLLTFVIVGGGPTGVEMAGALAEIARQSLRDDFRTIRPESAKIILLEGGPRLLAAFPESLAESARRSLVRLGVDVKTGSIVTSVDAEGVAVGGERIPAQTVVWAAGVAASPLARSLGVPLDRVGRVTPESTLAVPGQPRVFVAGDICSFQQDGALLPGVAQVAKQEGRHAAKNVLRAIRGLPLRPFRYRDYGNMATIGRGSAVAQIGPLRASGLFAWLIWLFIHIFWLIGFRNRAAVLGEWAWSYFTFQRRVRLITGGQLSPRS
ncbi:MAG TPA: NAD(P)/FAD-dependent oxidoreductase [Vicinamibacterales bacterium]|jgi:NADH dehydrogenase|nr:NAD(P)/FAD-dependent oxidoreductase [Vicinamibacterales bacterium]